MAADLDALLSPDLLKRWHRYHTASRGRVTREIVALLWPRTAATPRLQVVMIGAFNAAKSTLASVILGEDVAHCYGLPTTANVTAYVYSSVAALRIETSTGHLRDVRLDSRKDLLERWLDGKALLERLPPLGCDAEKVVTIGLPHPLLASGVVLIDTPGHDSPRTCDRELALRAVGKDAAVLYLCRANHLLGEEDLGVLRQICSRKRRWALVVTRAERKHRLTSVKEKMELHARHVLDGEDIISPETVLWAPDRLGDEWTRDPVGNHQRRQQIINILLSWQKTATGWAATRSGG